MKHLNELLEPKRDRRDGSDVWYEILATMFKIGLGLLGVMTVFALLAMTSNNCSEFLHPALCF